MYLAFAMDPYGVRIPFAIKFPTPKPANEDDGFKQFLSEARLLMKIKNERVAKFFEIGKHEGVPYIVMEHVDGIKLEKFLGVSQDQPRSMPLNVALTIACEIATSMEGLFRFRDPDNGELKQLVHGDMHPGNVILTFDGEIKIIDFGLARRESELATRSQEMGWANSRYASPYRLLYRRIDAKDDIFGLGMILWEMLTGVRYWGSLTTREISREMKRFDPVAPRTKNPAIPEDVDAIVLECLKIDEMSGYMRMDDLSRDLHAALRRHSSSTPSHALHEYMSQNCPHGPFLTLAKKRTFLELEKKISWNPEAQKADATDRSPESPQDRSNERTSEKRAEDRPSPPGPNPENLAALTDDIKLAPSAPAASWLDATLDLVDAVVNAFTPARLARLARWLVVAEIAILGYATSMRSSIWGALPSSSLLAIVRYAHSTTIDDGIYLLSSLKGRLTGRTRSPADARSADARLLQVSSSESIVEVYVDGTKNTEATSYSLIVPQQKPSLVMVKSASGRTLATLVDSSTRRLIVDFRNGRLTKD